MTFLFIAQLRCHCRFRRSRPCSRRNWSSPIPSFLDFYEELPPAIPAGLAYELRSWTRRTFTEFRELELRRLLEKLRSALPRMLF